MVVIPDEQGNACEGQNEFEGNKTNGITRMVERVPNLNVEEEAGTINLFDYLKKQ